MLTRVIESRRAVAIAARQIVPWLRMNSFYGQYDHPLWRHMTELAENIPVAADGFKLSTYLGSGEYIEDYRLINALKNGKTPDFDVYDAADWSVVTALSEKSVANRSSAVDFPDFTKGKCKRRHRLKIMGV